MAINCSEGTGKEGEISLYVKKWIDCTELSLKNSNESLESLCVRIRDQTNKRNLVVSVYYRLLGKREGVDKVFLLQEGSCLQALMVLGNFSHSDVYWKGAQQAVEARRLFESIQDNVLIHVIHSPSRKEVFLDLMLTNRDSELIMDVKIHGSLGCSHHLVVEFTVLKNMGQVTRKAV